MLSEMLNFVKGCLRVFYVVFAFCSALFLGALKGLIVGPIAGLILIFGNVAVILGLFPAHVVWTVYALLKTCMFDAALKFVLLFALPPLFGLWLALSIAGSVLVGVGYGFFTPWVSTFEAFRQGGAMKKFRHCIVDGTWGTIKGSCTVVRDFADFCYHSYPQYLKEIREGTCSGGAHTIKLTEVPACLVVGLMGLIVEIPLYTVIAIVKSPYMLFKGWQRLLHDLVSREGPFLETACVPVAGLAILLWPLAVVGSILMSIFSSFFIGLYGAVVVYQERSFRRGVAYVIAMVSEFDEYTNDWLYLREGSVLPKPRYRKKKVSHSSELSVGASMGARSKLEAPAMLVPTLAPSRSVREAIQEVRMLQAAAIQHLHEKMNLKLKLSQENLEMVAQKIWEDITRSWELRGRELVDGKVIMPADLNDSLRSSSQESIVSLGIPCYALLHCLLSSIKAGSAGLLLSDGTEVNQLNRPQDRFIDWFFHPILVIKEQIRVIKMAEGEVSFLQKLILFGDNTERTEAWDNGSVVPQDALRAAQIQAISRRLIGMTRSISKIPTYRRRFRQVVKALITYSVEGSSAHHSTRSASVSHSNRSASNRSVVSIEIV